VLYRRIMDLRADIQGEQAVAVAPNRRVLLAGAAAFASKPSTVTLPAILLLLVWWRRGRWQWRDVWLALPLFGMAVAMSVVTIVEQHRHIVGGGTNDWQQGWGHDSLGPAGRCGFTRSNCSRRWG
jgi:hypothetical protein